MINASCLVYFLQLLLRRNSEGKGGREEEDEEVRRQYSEWVKQQARAQAERNYRGGQGGQDVGLTVRRILLWAFFMALFFSALNDLQYRGCPRYEQGCNCEKCMRRFEYMKGRQRQGASGPGP